MNRFIIGIITFFLTFGISTSLVGLLFGFPKVGHSHSANTNTARNIQRVLESDMRYADSRRRSEVRLIRMTKRIARDGKLSEERSIELVQRYGALISKYSENSSSINTSHTPADFRYAWNKHMDAWNTEARMAATRGFNERVNGDSSEINKTWNQVLRIAKRYDVPMRDRYFR